MDESPLAINENSEKRYFEGWINRLIRWYYYFTEGMAQMNAARTIGYALIGIAGVLAIDGSSLELRNILMLGMIGLGFIPLLIFIGYLWVVRGKKSTEYFQIKYTSTFGRYSVELQEEQMRLLKEIAEGIRELNNKLDKENNLIPSNRIPESGELSQVSA